MATKKQPTKRTTASRSRKQSAAEEPASVSDAMPNTEPGQGDSVADLAHRLFMERGGAHGHDLDDWLEAERRIRNGHA